MDNTESYQQPNASRFKVIYDIFNCINKENGERNLKTSPIDSMFSPTEPTELMFEEDRMAGRSLTITAVSNFLIEQLREHLA